MDCPDPDELRRPDLVLQAVADRHPFDRPRALLAVVTGPYEQQRLTGSTVLWRQPPVHERARGRAADRAAVRLGLADAPLFPQHRPILVPVVVRPGASWWTWDESEVALAMRYCNQMLAVVRAGIVTVTDRGWYTQDDELSGTRPRAVWDSAAA